MPLTPNRSYETPPGGVQPDVPYWLQSLATQMDTDVASLLTTIANFTLAWNKITGKPSTFPSSWSTLSGKPSGADKAIYTGSSAPAGGTGSVGDIYIQY